MCIPEITSPPTDSSTFPALAASPPTEPARCRRLRTPYAPPACRLGVQPCKVGPTFDGLMRSWHRRHLDSTRPHRPRHATGACRRRRPHRWHRPPPSARSLRRVVGTKDARNPSRWPPAVLTVSKHVCAISPARQARAVLGSSLSVRHCCAPARCTPPRLHQHCHRQTRRLLTCATPRRSSPRSGLSVWS